MMHGQQNVKFSIYCYHIYSACAGSKSVLRSEIQRAEWLAAYTTSPGELEGVPAAEAVGFLSAIVVELSTAAVLARWLGDYRTLPMLSCTLETRGWRALIYVLEGRFVDVVVLYLVMRAAFLTTVHVIGVGWYGLVRRWTRDKGTLGLRNGCGSRNWWSFGNMITLQNPESVFTCRIFYADLLTIWVNIGIRTYSGAVGANGFALLKTVVCGEGVFEAAILTESLLVH